MSEQKKAPKWLHDLAACLNESNHARRHFDRANGKWGYRRVESPLTADLVDRTVTGTEESVAGYVLKDTGHDAKGQVLVFDFDDHTGKVSAEVMRRCVSIFSALLHTSEIPHFVVTSGGGRGYHIWVVFECPRRHDAIREMGRKFIDAANKQLHQSWPHESFQIGTRGICAHQDMDKRGRTSTRHEIEVFPKGSGLVPIALPLSRESRLLLPDYNGGTAADVKFQEHPNSIAFELPIFKARKPGPKPKAENAKEADRGAAAEALEAKCDPSDYDQWVAYAHYLKAAFPNDLEWCKARWMAWSHEASNADPDHKLEKKWERAISGDPRCSPTTFWLSARNAGYKGALPFATKTTAAEYRRSDAEDPRTFLFECGQSMRRRGWDDADTEREIRHLNDGLGEQRLEDIEALLTEILALEQRTAPVLPYSVVEKFNRRYALLNIDGALEVLDREADTFCTFTLGNFFHWAAPERARCADGKVIEVARNWINDVDRKEYHGLVIEPIDYDGPGFNLWRGFAVEPKEGDVSPFLKLLDYLCAGDEDGKRWLIHWLADMVQRPTENGIGTAVALRGPQGQGKSFLSLLISRMFRAENTVKMSNADHFFGRFNRHLMGRVFVAGEEVVFHGSKADAQRLKDMITGDDLTFEEKHKSVVTMKNVLRLLDTTNDDHAVHIDADDRRWTIFEIEQTWDLETEEGRDANHAYFASIRAFINGDGPARLLHYLLQVEVDDKLIRYPYLNDAKASDKTLSDPVLAVLDDLASTGVIPHDVHGEGKLANKSLVELVKACGGYSRESSGVLVKRLRRYVGGEAVDNCQFMRELRVVSNPDEGVTVRPIWEYGQRGTLLPTLNEFRARVAKITRKSYGQGKWQTWLPPSPGMCMSDDEAEALREVIGSDTL